jgi:hypothetical protein
VNGRGAAITLLTRMRTGTDDDVAEVVASVAFLMAGPGMFHSGTRLAADLQRVSARSTCG